MIMIKVEYLSLAITNYLYVAMNAKKEPYGDCQNIFSTKAFEILWNAASSVSIMSLNRALHVRHFSEHT